MNRANNDVMRNESDYRLFRLVNFVIALLVLYGTHGVAFAEDRRNGGPTPSAEGAKELWSIHWTSGLSHFRSLMQKR
jgi:hypothetical protein